MYDWTEFCQKKTAEFRATTRPTANVSHEGHIERKLGRFAVLCYANCGPSAMATYDAVFEVDGDGNPMDFDENHEPVTIGYGYAPSVIDDLLARQS
jgi:hypothetical protein